jgi:hypothetical protein
MTSARAMPTLAHAARELARQRALETVQADQLDRRSGLLRALGRRHAARLEPELDVLLHRQPGKERKRLEDHADAAHRPLQRLAAIVHLPGVGRDQPGHDAQQRALARTGLAEHRDDLALAQREVHALEDDALVPVGRAKALAHALQLEDSGALGGVSRHRCILVSASR